MTVVAVVGSRGWPDCGEVWQYVEKIARKHPDAVIVSGGARGPDRTSEEAAHALGLDWISYRPYEYENIEGRAEFSIETVTEGDEAQRIVVEKHRRISPPFFRTFRAAAYHRNGWIVDDVDEAGAVVAFHDGRSRGTADTMARTSRAGKRLVLRLPGDARASRRSLPSAQPKEPDEIPGVVGDT